MQSPKDCGTILIVIDGCRPDGIQQAETPAMDSLMARGAYTLNAQSVVPSSTLPCHTSMFRGVTPSRHGITTNTWVPMVRPVPSIAEAAHAANRKTAFVYNWEQLRDLAGPGSLDFSYYRNNLDDAEGDLTIARTAAEHLVAEQPDFCFVYLGMVDIVGHRNGWMSEEYIEQIGTADRAIAILLAELEKAGLLDRYFILVQSDHGGHGQSHGTDMPEDLTIPWIAAGARIRKTGEIEQPVRIIDTAPTLAHVLDLPLAEDWEGRPALEIF